MKCLRLVKYSLYGGVSAGLMLFGLSHIYGVFGTIQFTSLVDQLNQLNMNKLLSYSFILIIFVGLGYKIACVLSICGHRMFMKALRFQLLHFSRLFLSSLVSQP